MKNYRKLNLPPNPLKDTNAILSMNITGGYNLRLPADVLNDNVLEVFRGMGLSPKFVSLFGRNDTSGEIENRMIHTDIQYLGGDKCNKESWKRLIFGINWEIEGSHNIFSWWDMNAVNECYPAEDLVKKYDILNGIHYVKRGNLGVPEGAKKIEETVIDGPTLVRTNIPHMTLYHNPKNTRVGISVRFDESKFNGWDDVVKYFEPYTIVNNGVPSR